MAPSLWGCEWLTPKNHHIPMHDGLLHQHPLFCIKQYERADESDMKRPNEVTSAGYTALFSTHVDTLVCVFNLSIFRRLLQVREGSSKGLAKYSLWRLLVRDCLLARRLSCHPIHSVRALKIHYYYFSFSTLILF